MFCSTASRHCSMAVTWALLSRKAVSGERNATAAMEPNRELLSSLYSLGEAQGRKETKGENDLKRLMPLQREEESGTYKNKRG